MATPLATALYIEMRKHSNTAQLIIIPPMKLEASGSPEPMRIMSRQISTSHPRRSWRFYKCPVHADTYASEDIVVALDQTIPFIMDIQHYFNGFKAADWKVYLNPVSVEMTFDDLSEVKSANTPQAFMRRLNRARTGAGYSEELFNTQL